MTSTIALIIVSLLSSPLIMAADENTIEIPYDEPEDSMSKKERLVYFLHSYNSPGHLDDVEHDAPVYLQYRPTLVPLPFGHRLPDNFVVEDDQLELRSLTPQLLESLSDHDLAELLGYLATVEVEMRYSNIDGKIQSGKKHHVRKSSCWQTSNGAAVIALRMAVEGKHKLFATMTALAPSAIIPEIHGRMFAVLTPVITADIIAKMLMTLDGNDVGLADPMAKQIGTLIHRSSRYWVGKDVTLFNPYMQTILGYVTPIIEQDDGIAHEERLGVLMGSVLSGIMLHAQTIKKTDEKRIWILGLVANLAWASTTFIGIAPLAAPVVAGMAGTLSIGAVISTALMTALQFPRDYAPNISEMRATIHMGFLEAARQKNVEDKVDLMFMYHWIDASIESNGF